LHVTDSCTGRNNDSAQNNLSAPGRLDPLITSCSPALSTCSACICSRASGNVLFSGVHACLHALHLDLQAPKLIKTPQLRRSPRILSSLRLFYLIKYLKLKKHACKHGEAYPRRLLDRASASMLFEDTAAAVSSGRCQESTVQVHFSPLALPPGRFSSEASASKRLDLRSCCRCQQPATIYGIAENRISVRSCPR